MPGRRITRTGYAGFGAVAGLLAIACAGFASIAIQLGGAGWIAMFVILLGLTVALFWLCVKLLMRARLHPPDEPGPARDRPPA